MNKFNKKAITNLEGKVARGQYSALELEKLLLKGVIDKKTYDNLIERFFQDMSEKSVEELEEELMRLTKLKQDNSDKKTIEKIKNDMDKEIKKLKEEIHILDSKISNNSEIVDIPQIKNINNQKTKIQNDIGIVTAVCSIFVAALLVLIFG